MDIRPIFSTLRRHKTTALLIVAELALTCAILCNAIDLVATRLSAMRRDSGFAESELVTLSLSGIGPQANADALTQQDLSVLREVPGVRSVAIVNQVPYGHRGWNTSVQLTPEQQHSTLNTSQYFGSEAFLATAGLRLVAGRDFHADEFINYSVVQAAGKPDRAVPIIVNQAMADRLFPDGGSAALGKTIYTGNASPLSIVGIVAALSPPQNMRQNRPAMLMPMRVPYNNGSYLMRVDPAQRSTVLKAAAAALLKVNPNRVLITHQTIEEAKAEFFQQDRAMAWLLVAVCAALLTITAFGIVGLASFWVQQRTRMIGTRRALGATRSQILRYFQLENFLLTTVGIALGMAGAYGISLLLMRYYELPRLPAIYLPVGAIAVWALGQIAVLGPALRAAAVPPVAALRGR